MTRAAAVLLSAGLYGLAFPPFEHAALAFVALVPLALALRGRGPRQAAALAAAWAFAATALVVAWVVPTLTGHFERSRAEAVGFLVLLALGAAAPFLALAFAAHAAACARAPAALRPPLFAVAWVAAEYLRSHLGLASPWARLGDTQFGSERLRQLADLAGVYGLGGLVALANACAAELAAELGAALRGARAAQFRPALGSAALLAALLAAALGYGSVRRAEHAPAASGFEVALVQGNVPAALRWHRATASLVLRRYGGLTRDLLRASGAGAPDLVIWPENALQTPVDDPVYGRALVRLAARVPLLLGAPRSEAVSGARRRFNSVLLLRADGRAESYDKRRLLPFGETRPLGLAGLGARGDLDAAAYAAGTEPGLFRLAGRTLGVLICLEAAYPELAREAVAAGATVLVNPSNDGWYRGAGGARQHLAHAVLRAVETRTPVLRATTTGITAVIAPDGSIVAELAAGTAGVLRASVPAASSGASFYARTGDVLPRACVGLCLLGALAARAPRSRRAPGAGRGARR